MADELRFTPTDEDLDLDPAFTCPRCGATSHHPTDAKEKYCGRCHDWTRDG